MNQATSPFKFLDSYKQEDAEIFFGRKEETEHLYDALSGVKHLLVYGPSGAGKTSLIECGLRNQFSDADWYALSIRRGKDMIASTYARINEALQEPIPLNPATGLPGDSTIDFGKAIQRLFGERFQPVYLLFDQFEELLISGEESEKQEFFQRIDQLIRFKVPCRVIFIMREEFIGHLSEFEHLCPSIFQHRFRLEKMTRAKVQTVIHSILDAEYYEDFYEVEEPEQLAETILSKLPDDRKEIDLSHVQVFLSELWDRAIQERSGMPILRMNLVKAGDDLAGVLDSFLKKQLKELESSFGDTIPLEILAVMISERFTKLQLDESSLREELDFEEMNHSFDLPSLLQELQNRRIVRKIKSGEQTQYEISHDTLAQVIGQNLTEEIQLRRKADDIYEVYKEREGFFSQEDLDFIRPYSQYRDYPEELASRIQASEAHLVELEDERIRVAEAQTAEERRLKEEAVQQATIAEANASRARKRTLVAAGIAVVALLVAGLAYYLYDSLDEQRKLVQEREEEVGRKEKEIETLTLNLGKQEVRVLEEQSKADSMTNVADSMATVAIVEQEKVEDLLAKYDILVQNNLNNLKGQIKTLLRIKDWETARKIMDDLLLAPAARNDPEVEKLRKQIKEKRSE